MINSLPESCLAFIIHHFALIVIARGVMSEVKRIKSELRRAFEGEAWHGPSVMEILAGVTAEQAAARPIATAHTIWEITLHITAWESVVLRRVKGEAVGSMPDEENFPTVADTGEEAWQQAIEKIKQVNLALREAIGALDDSQLSDIAAGTNYSIYFMLHGVIQHDLYHAGQIALLKKALP